MTTLNTIIEEEKKEFEEKIDTICKQADQYQINAGYPVSTPAKTIILSLFTSAMQRAYEAGYKLAVEHLKEAYTHNATTTVPEAIEWLEDNSKYQDKK